VCGGPAQLLHDGDRPSGFFLGVDGAPPDGLSVAESASSFVAEGLVAFPYGKPVYGLGGRSALDVLAPPPFGRISR